MNSKKQERSVLDGIEQSAISIISRAVQYDNEGKYPSALACYQEGIQLFLDVIKNTNEKKKQEHLRLKATEYMTRAERIKDVVQKQKDTGVYHEQIQIPNDGVGYSYEKVFSKYLEKSITRVDIEDPYIRTNHQTYNFLSFCELLVRFCPNLKHVNLVTGPNDQEPGNQISRFENIKSSLNEYNVELSIEYSETLHDREIKLDNGYIIKIGRGLDYFKHTKKFALGFCDQNLRRCHETTIDIFFKNK